MQTTATDKNRKLNKSQKNCRIITTIKRQPNDEDRQQRLFIKVAFQLLGETPTVSYGLLPVLDDGAEPVSTG